MSVHSVTQPPQGLEVHDSGGCEDVEASPEAAGVVVVEVVVVVVPVAVAVVSVG